MYDRVNQAEQCGYVGLNPIMRKQSAFEEERAMTTPGDPIRAVSGRSEIASALEQQEKLSSVLHDVLSALEQKLQPVYASVPEPGRTDPASAPMPCATTIGSCISQNSDRILTAIHRVQMLTRGIQI